MATVLLTAFEPYDCWEANASWLALAELVRNLPDHPQITTRLYPVDFPRMTERLEDDLASNYDYALHLGQAPGAPRIKLEMFGLNIGGSAKQPPEEYGPLMEDGPPAYRSALPLAAWSGKLQSAGVPACVSHHAGAFLCNATLYMSHYFTEKHSLKTAAAFVHVPLAVSQTAARQRDAPSLPTSLVVLGLRLILEELADE